MNDARTKLIIGVFVALLLAGCQSPERRIVYERGILDIAAEKYGWRLPAVDRVEISVLDSGGATATNGFPSRVDGLSFYRIARQKIITGREAEEFRSKWSSMAFWWGFGAMCHEPAYGLRFFHGQSVLLETTLCWKCSNFEVPTPLGYRFMGFDETRPEANTFWKLLQGHMPLPEGTKNVRN